ncbi:MAG: autotransporter domain-containing protein [Alphaproteobacteria bacterium]|nr:autotransporter domain-containing protein [Alphaproteobacteria bacterium]
MAVAVGQLALICLILTISAAPIEKAAAADCEILVNTTRPAKLNVGESLEVVGGVSLSSDGLQTGNACPDATTSLTNSVVSGDGGNTITNAGTIEWTGVDDRTVNGVFSSGVNPSEVINTGVITTGTNSYRDIGAGPGGGDIVSTGVSTQGTSGGIVRNSGDGVTGGVIRSTMGILFDSGDGVVTGVLDGGGQPTAITGLIEGTNGTAIGIEGRLLADFVNAGEIRGTGNGLNIGDLNGMLIENQTDGLIRGGNFPAIFVDSGNGTITNQADAEISASSSVGIRLDDRGSLTNAGTITGGDGDGVFIQTLSGAVQNGGTIQGSANGIDVRDFNGQSIVNQTGGKILGDDFTALFVDSGNGTITNQMGAEISASSAAGVVLDDEGSLTNAGTITGGDGDGVFIQTLSGAVQNAGTIQGSANGIDVRDFNGQSIVNQTGGEILSDNFTALFVDSGNGTIANEAGAEISSTSSFGMFVRDQVALTNAGTINGGGGVGARIAGGLSDTLQNSGTIQGSTNGLSVGDINGQSIFNQSGGVIETTDESSGFAGIAIFGGSGRIVNEEGAFIRAPNAITFSPQAIYVDEAAVQVDIENRGTLSAANTIEAHALSDIDNWGRVESILVGDSDAVNLFGSGSTFVNHAGAEVVANNDAFFLGFDDVTDVFNVINQAGALIRGDGDGNGGGLSIHGVRGVDQITNAGTIIGDVELNEGADSVTNSGTITGDIDLGSGADQMTLNTGSTLNGAVDGGSDNDTVTLNGSGAEDSAFANFETLTVSDGADWTLSGNSDFSDSVSVGSGSVLRIGSGGASGDIGAASVVNEGALVLNRSDSVTVSNAMSGSGSLRHVGSGVTTLTGASSYTGATTVERGELVVNGSISNSVLTTVSGPGTLAGTGTVGAASVLGTIAPGNSIGNLSVIGNYTQTGAYELEFRAPAIGVAPVAGVDNDFIDITGTATLTGGTVVLVPVSGVADYEAARVAGSNPTPGELRYLILQADGGRGGTEFVALSTTGATLAYPNATDVELVVNGPLSPVLFTSEPPESTLEVDQALWRRALFTTAARRPYCDAASTSQGSQYCGFVEGAADFGDRPRATTGTTSIEAAPSGLIGFGANAASDLWLGVALGLSDASLVDDAASDSDYTEASGYFWASWTPGAFDIKASVGLGYYDVDAKREVELGGAATTDFDAWQPVASVEARRWSDMGSGWRITPVAGLQATMLSRESRDESGGGVESFQSDRDRVHSLKSTLGVGMDWTGDWAGTPVTLAGEGAWAHEFGSDSPRLKGVYEGDDTETVLRRNAPEFEADSALVRASATVALTDATQARLSYTGAYASDADNHTVALRLSFGF